MLAAAEDRERYGHKPIGGVTFQMRILVVFGTRPEAIKLAPVVHALQGASDRFEVLVCATAQHREMLDSVLRIFEITPDYDLDLMTPDQTLENLTAAVLQRFPAVLEKERPDAVLVQGDTTTVMAAALCAHYRQIDIGHVEAGLRSGNLLAPFPEEANRRIVSQVATWNFAPTIGARENLLRAGVDPDSICVTGNTVVDALLEVVEKAKRLERPPEPILHVPWNGSRVVLITGHRRESHGAPLLRICDAFRRLAEANREVHFVYPVHLNPRVKGPVNEALAGVENFHLTEPLDYLAMVWAMDRAHLIITDSGGIQEEAPALGVPVLVTREVTERTEGVEAGTAKLVGADPDTIVAEAQRLLDDAEAHRAMARAVNPYGDGHASERILEFLEKTQTRK
jgi:UDP-N-acetylglucosamine 2-epimerase